MDNCLPKTQLQAKINIIVFEVTLAQWL